jgi:hypothetical protein
MTRYTDNKWVLSLGNFVNVIYTSYMQAYEPVRANF